MPANPLVINPINYLVGRWLQQLRRDRGNSNAAEVAKRLGIAASTYRLVEAGRVAMPAYCAAELASLFDLPVLRVAAGLGLVASLNDAQLDLRVLRRRAQALATLDPSLAWIASNIEAWLALADLAPGEPRRAAAEQQLITRLGRLITGESTPRYSQVSDASRDLVMAKLSPILHDALDDWIEQHSHFSPVMSFGACLRWFAERAARVTQLRLYINEPLGMLNVASSDRMVAEFLRNPHDPKVMVAVGADMATPIGQAVRGALRAAAKSDPFLGRGQRALKEESVAANVLIRRADAGFEKALQPIQFARVPGNAAALSPDPDATLIHDLWLIDYIPRRTGSAPRSVGFVTLYERRRRGSASASRSGYAVVLNASVTADFARLFDAHWPRLKSTK